MAAIICSHLLKYPPSHLLFPLIYQQITVEITLSDIKTSPVSSSYFACL